MTPTVSDYSRLPQELKQLKQWCVAGSDKAPYVASGDNLRRVSVHEIDSLHTYEEACQIAAYFNVSIGFILTANDGLTCIDLDVKDANSKDKNGQPLNPKLWTTQADLDRFAAIIGTFNTYAELSQSGQGAHLWLWGDIGKGARRDSVEVYSQERFIICTGNAFRWLNFNLDPSSHVVTTNITDSNPLPLNVGQQQNLASMVSQMQSGQVAAELLTEIEEELTDRELIDRAMRADNADKFNQLCIGDWQAMGYESQSEADLSLMSMFTFYSKSNTQCRRLFRMTGLGEREKATQDNVYIDRTLKLIRGRQQGEEEVQLHGEALAAQLINNLQSQGMQQIAAAPAAVEQAAMPAVQGNELPWPPGLAGAIASFIYHNSNRPVREVAIVGALGLLAGICGKAYAANSKTGLNVYITLIARSGIGKEGMHNGVSTLIRKLMGVVPTASQFVTFTDFASGPALIKYCGEHSSFVNVAGEWGKKLKQMSREDGREGPMQQFRTAVTTLYSKSGPQSIAGGMTYSNKDNDVESTAGIAFSLIGETTPDTFYESLTGGMMEDGFLSRFTMVEHTGNRPPHNYQQLEEPDENLINALVGLVTQAATLLGRFETQLVEYSPEALAMAKQHDEECDAEINRRTDESFRQMWNRAHLKVLRTAGLLAVADNWLQPTVQVEHLEWAINLVHRDINIVSKRLLEGDVGTDDGSRDRKILQIIKEYLTQDMKASYKINPTMRADGVVPKRYLQTRCHRLTSFKTHRLGANNAVDLSIRSLIESGYLVEMDKVNIMTKYKKTERCFRVVDLGN